MLHATEIIGAETYDSFGNYVGRVKEMFVEPADQPNRVAHLLLSRGQYRPLVARYDQIASVAPGRITLTTDESALTLYQPNEAWLAVGKDLLDQQIIDTNGRKVVRVNDIDLSPAHQRQHRTPHHPSGRRPPRRRPPPAPGNSPANGHPPNPTQASASQNSLGICESRRTRSSPPRKTPPFQSKTRSPSSG